MKKSPIDRMKSVNIHLTDNVLSAVEDLAGGNRSQATRYVLASILAASDAGNTDPIQQVSLYAQNTSPKVRSALSHCDAEVFRKSIIWVPESMFKRIDAEARNLGIRASDFIRGALFGLAGYDPSQILSREGHELWAPDVKATP